MPDGLSLSSVSADRLPSILREMRLDAAKQALSGLGGRDAAGRAVSSRRPSRSSSVLHGLAQGRLGDAEPDRRPGETALRATAMKATRSLTFSRNIHNS